MVLGRNSRVVAENWSASSLAISSQTLLFLLVMALAYIFLIQLVVLDVAYVSFKSEHSDEHCR
jgi:hypothetical protein